MRQEIICGDTVSELRKLPDSCVDLIFADPPYWMRVDGVLSRVEGTAYDGCDDAWDQFETLADYERFTQDWLTECCRVLKPDGSIWVIGGMQCIYSIGAIMQRLGFWLINDVIWHKKNPTPNFMGTRLNNSHETLIWATKSKKAKYRFNYKTAKELNRDTVPEAAFARGERKQLGSVWSIGVCQGAERLRAEDGSKLHSTQKPEELLYRIIAISSKKGDLVLDPFGGTMTTAAMAKKLGRQFIMIERDQTYCRYGQARVDAIAYEDTPIANAVFDEKPAKVSIKEMISAGCFAAGEPFYLKNGAAVARLCPDGRLEFNGKIMDMHACAAAAKGGKAQRLNGFAVWHVLRDGQLVSIADIREAYRSGQREAAQGPAAE